MADFRLTVTGPTGEIDGLEQFCRKHGVATERGLVSSYDGIAVSVFALHAIATFDVLAQCLAAYGTAQNAPLKVSYFVPGKGHRTVKDYTFEAVAKVLRKTHQLHLGS